MVLPARLSRRSLVIAAITLVATAIVASFGWRSASAATVSVEGGNNYFCSSAFDGSVCETDISAGDTVTWTISGGTHTVTQCTTDYSQCPPAGGWDSGIVTRNATFSQMFATPGTYAYRCELHPSEMLGKIVVAAVTPSPTPVATAAPTDATAAALATETPAALPKMGAAPNGGMGVALYLSLGITLLAGAGIAFTFARKKT